VTIRVNCAVWKVKWTVWLFTRAMLC